MTTERRDPRGRKSKGPRTAVQVHLPTTHYDALQAAAAAARVTVSDFGATLLAVGLQRPRRGSVPIGQLWSGERDMITARMPTETVAVLDNAARTAGLTRSGFGAVLIAEAMGLPPMVTSPQARSTDVDEELVYDMAG